MLMLKHSAVEILVSAIAPSNVFVLWRNVNIMNADGLS